MLFFIDSQKMTTMAVLDQFAIRNLDIFEYFEPVIDDGEDLKTWGETDSHEETTRMHGYRYGFFGEGVRNQAFLLIPLNLEEVP